MKNPEQLRQQAEKKIDKRVRRSLLVQSTLQAIATTSGILANRALMAGQERLAAISLGVAGLVGVTATRERVVAFRKMEKIVNRYSRDVVAEPGARIQLGDSFAQLDASSYVAPFMASFAFAVAGVALDHEVTNNNSTDVQGVSGYFGGWAALAGGALGFISEDKSRGLKKTFKQQLANIEFSVNLPLNVEAQLVERRVNELVGEAKNGRFQFHDETGKEYEVALVTEETEWTGRRHSASKERTTTIAIKEVLQEAGDAPFEEIQINTKMKMGDRFSPRSSVSVTVGNYDGTGERHVTAEDAQESPFEERDERVKRMERIRLLLKKVTPESRIATAQSVEAVAS